MLNIQPTDRVLEIGSGNRPRKRSNVLCDKFIVDNTERSAGDDIVIDNRPFVIADGLALPFKDKSFDYVITSHILEHVDDPLEFVRELTRVAKGGYIETPSELGEKIFGWPFHKWIVRFQNNTIVMRRRMESSPFGDYFHKKYANDLNFAEFIDSHFEDFYVQYAWTNTLKLQIEKDDSSTVRFNTKMEPVNTRPTLRKLGLVIVTPFSSFLLRLCRLFRKFEQ